MWTELVVVSQPRFKDMPQVALAKDDEVVEAFSLGAADPDAAPSSARVPVNRVAPTQNRQPRGGEVKL